MSCFRRLAASRNPTEARSLQSLEVFFSWFKNGRRPSLNWQAWGERRQAPDDGPRLLYFDHRDFFDVLENGISVVRNVDPDKLIDYAVPYKRNHAFNQFDPARAADAA